MSTAEAEYQKKKAASAEATTKSTNSGRQKPDKDAMTEGKMPTTSEASRLDESGHDEGDEEETACSNSEPVNDASGIAHPTDLDILLGRGKYVNYHPGNVQFRQLVRKHKVAYVSCPKPQKANYAQDIVHELRARGSRFLKQGTQRGDKLWYEIDTKQALLKTRQALREGAPEISEELMRTGQKHVKKPEKVIQELVNQRKQQQQPKPHDSQKTGLPPREPQVLTDSASAAAATASRLIHQQQLQQLHMQQLQQHELRETPPLPQPHTGRTVGGDQLQELQARPPAPLPLPPSRAQAPVYYFYHPPMGGANQTLMLPTTTTAGTPASALGGASAGPASLAPTAALMQNPMLTLGSPAMASAGGASLPPSITTAPNSGIYLPPGSAAPLLPSGAIGGMLTNLNASSLGATTLPPHLLAAAGGAPSVTAISGTPQQLSQLNANASLVASPTNLPTTTTTPLSALPPGVVVEPLPKRRSPTMLGGSAPPKKRMRNYGSPSSSVSSSHSNK